jgi:hypothetical protein
VVARHRAKIPDPITGKLLESQYQPPNSSKLLSGGQTKNSSVTYKDRQSRTADSTGQGYPSERAYPLDTNVTIGVTADGSHSGTGGSHSVVDIIQDNPMRTVVARVKVRKIGGRAGSVGQQSLAKRTVDS